MNVMAQIWELNVQLQDFVCTDMSTSALVTAQSGLEYAQTLRSFNADAYAASFATAIS